jgi:hypothetical protein
LSANPVIDFADQRGHVDVGRLQGLTADSGEPQQIIDQLPHPLSLAAHHLQLPPAFVVEPVMQVLV